MEDGLHTDEGAVAARADVSIVVPLYDEEDNVGPLHDAVTEALADCPWRYELVLVDDGSKDETFARAKALVEKDARVRTVGLRRNFGQTAAMAAGIQCARGDIIVTMDGDLQNDPRDIPALVAMVNEGYDLATGWRRKRQDDNKRVAISKVANRIMGKVLGVQIRDSGCSLKAYRAALIQSLPLYGEMHRFIPALGQLAGSRTAQIEVRHHPRRFGKSKYGFSRIYKVMLDIISIRFLITYARHPIMSFAWPAAAFVLLGLAMLGLISAEHHASLAYSSAAVLLFATAGFLMCWGVVGLVFAALEPRMMELARVGAEIWRHGPAEEQRGMP
jgi:glycosyltransferase involved in cell wall biosynthesis